jgi:hypothetical protein
MNPRWRNTLVILLAIAGVLLAAGVYISIPGHTPSGQPALVDLSPRSLAELQADFNRTSAGFRVVLLISPT